MVQGGSDGRDHHNRCFSIWLAGGGVKSGHVHGQTDELGFNVAEDAVHVHDLNATLLYLLGLDHLRLDLSLSRPRLSPDRRSWQAGSGHYRGLTASWQGLPGGDPRGVWLPGWGCDLLAVRAMKLT